MEFAVLANHRVKLRESEKKDKYLDLARELIKLWNVKVTIIPIVNGDFYSHQMVIKETGALGNKRTCGYHPNYNVIENGLNTEKNPGNLLSLKLQ